MRVSNPRWLADLNQPCPSTIQSAGGLATKKALWKKCAPGGFAHKPPKATCLHTVPMFVVVFANEMRQLEFYDCSLI